MAKIKKNKIGGEEEEEDEHQKKDKTPMEKRIISPINMIWKLISMTFTWRLETRVSLGKSHLQRHY